MVIRWYHFVGLTMTGSGSSSMLCKEQEPMEAMVDESPKVDFWFQPKMDCPDSCRIPNSIFREFTGFSWKTINVSVIEINRVARKLFSRRKPLSVLKILKKRLKILKLDKNRSNNF